MTTVQDALADLYQNITIQLRNETIDVHDALDRVIAVAPRSPIDLPEFVRSTMDGYAVRAEDTYGASESLPAYLNCRHIVHMGTVPDFVLESGEAAEIHTGAMLPGDADAVVMIEQTQRINETEIEVLEPVAPGENLVQVGEDVRKDSDILPVGHRVRPQDIGGLLAVGISTVEVKQPPRVAILSCGDELVSPEDTPRQGQIRDINAYILEALFRQTGALVHLAGIAQDTLDSMLPMAQQAFAQSDILVITAGSSVSTRDLTQTVINRLGQPGVIQHGLAVKPGKPTILASCDGKPAIGLPGNPVSAMLVTRLVVLPLIHHLLGEPSRPVATVDATLNQNIASASGRLDTVPVQLIETQSGYEAQPVLGKSNLIYRLVNADGLLTVPLNLNGIKAGTQVKVVLF